MKTGENLRRVLQIAGGTVLVLVIALLAIQYREDQGVAARAALRATRLDRVEGMRAALLASSDAEKSAVMATTDEASQSFAEQSRAASGVVEAKRNELAKLLEAGGTAAERDLLARFSQAFAECQRIDRELLELSVKNTNLKAYDLTFGPAAEALARQDGALSRILDDLAVSAEPKAREGMRLAAGAQSGAWRIQALLPPHIFEESDPRMTELEGRMAEEDRGVRQDLAGLVTLMGSGNPQLATAQAEYARFTELKARILELSRQNTNVRTLILSLNQKRQAVRAGLDELDALESAIRDESLSETEPENPR